MIVRWFLNENKNYVVQIFVHFLTVHFMVTKRVDQSNHKDMKVKSEVHSNMHGLILRCQASNMSNCRIVIENVVRIHFFPYSIDNY